MLKKQGHSVVIASKGYGIHMGFGENGKEHSV
jgi:hypothetical protein